MAADVGESIDGPRSDDTALTEEHRMRGDLLGLGHVVRCEHHGGAARGEPVDDVPDGVATVDVDARGGLVEEGHFGIGGEGECERDALLFPARQAPPRGPRTMTEPDGLDECGRVDAPTMQCTEMRDDVAYACARVHTAALKHDSHAGREFTVLRGGVETEHPDSARLRASESLADFDGAGLAGPVRTEDHRDLSGGGDEGHVVDREDVSVSHGEVLDGHGHVLQTRSRAQSSRGAKGHADSLVHVIDVRLLRTNLDDVRAALARRGKPDLMTQVDSAVSLDARLRELANERDNIRAEVNDLSKQVGALRRDKKVDEAEALQERSRVLGERERELAAETDTVQEELRQVMLRIPNMPHPAAPDGSGDHENPVVKGPIGLPDTFPDHQRVAHWDTATELGILDNERATKISGAMFTMQRGQGATLARALCQFALDTNADAFEEVRPPSMVTTATLTATGHLPKFADDAYAIERDDLWAIPTAEVPLTSLHAGEVLEESQLPVRLMAYTPCYRREAGSAGRDTRGMLRAHEFDKVEILAISRPEDSPVILDELVARAEKLIAALELPYRIIEICTGDMGGSHHRSYDIEVYAPGCDAWLEVSSVSWFSDYQARRADIRFKRTGQKGTEIAHTLNGSALAVPRVWAAICENHRQPDGTVRIPDALRPYMRGATHITPKA